MQDVQWQVFAHVVAQVETPLVRSVSEVVTVLLSFVAAPLKVSLVLYVALTGILILRGANNEVGATLLGRFLKMGLVVWVLTGSGVYRQYVYDFFFTTLPLELANVLASSGGVHGVTANSFDLVWVKAWRAGLEVWRTLGWRDIAEKLVIVLFWGVAIVSTVFSFAIWLVSRVLLSLYIALGPLLIGLVLFSTTRPIFERWIGSLIACVILQVTTVVLLCIVLAVEQIVVGKIAEAGATGSMGMIQILFACIIFFAVATFVTLQLPDMAAALTGGLSFHSGPLARGAQAIIGSLGWTQVDCAGNRHRVGRSGLIGVGHYAASMVGRGAGALGRSVYQRVRPTTGGSLSDSG